MFHPGDGVADHIAAAALDAVVTVLIAAALLMKTGVEGIEAAIEPGAMLALGSRISEPMKAAVW